jgi:hypothetical protein
MKQVPDVIQILLPQRLIKTELFHQFRMPLRRNAAFPCHQQDRIARQNAHKTESQNSDTEKCRYQIGNFA